MGWWALKAQWVSNLAAYQSSLGRPIGLDWSPGIGMWVTCKFWSGRERKELSEASGWGWSFSATPPLSWSLYRKETGHPWSQLMMLTVAMDTLSAAQVLYRAERGTFSWTMLSPGTLKHYMVDFNSSPKREALTEVQSRGFQSIPLGHWSLSSSLCLWRLGSLKGHIPSHKMCTCFKCAHAGPAWAQHTSMYMLQELTCPSCPLCLVCSCLGGLCCVSCRFETGRTSVWEPVCKGRGAATRWHLSCLKEKGRDPREKKERRLLEKTLSLFGWGIACLRTLAQAIPLPSHSFSSWPHSEALSLWRCPWLP